MIGDVKHVLNRGVAKGQVFFDDNDYYRFVGNLYRLNNKNGALRVVNNKLFINPPEQDKLVDILKWSLLPNHYHLLLYECVDGGIVEFTKRIGNAYTKYVNIKNQRSGYLFQNSAKIVDIKEHSHFLYVPMYIDLNPLDLYNSRWKKTNIKVEKLTDYLINYPWSSFGDYFGKDNFPMIISKERFKELFEISHDAYFKELKEFIKNPSGLDFE